MGKAATLGLAPAVFGPLMNITGSILASYWHRKPPVDKETPGLKVVHREQQVQV
jgi:BASS family bile acid:Na+ symporter